MVLKAYALPEGSSTTTLTSLTVEVIPTEDEAIAVARVSERSGELRQLTRGTCLIRRYALATVYTAVVCLVDHWCFVHTL